MSKQAKKIYRALGWFFSAVIACGSLAGCGHGATKYGAPVSKYGPPPSGYVTPAKTTNDKSTP